MRNPNTECCECGCKIYRRPSHISKFEQSFCSECNKKKASKAAIKKKDDDYINFISRWKLGDEDGIISNGGGISNFIKRYIREKFDQKCCVCGWNKTNEFTGKIPLEIDHIDGNPCCNIESNLRLICPNCHSLTKTYKGANKGNGRFSRLERYKQNKSY